MPKNTPGDGRTHACLPEGHRCSAFVLDLADNTIKIADIPASVRQSISSWCGATGKDPCTATDTAFRISVKGQGLLTRYSTVAVPISSGALDGVEVPPRAELEARLLAARRISTEEEIQERMAKA